MMNAKQLCRRLAYLMMCLAVAGCMLVDDFSLQWDKAKPDSCINKIAESLYYVEFRRDPTGKDMSQLARTLTIDKSHFLMLKMDPADKGGRMYRFGVVNGIYQRYRLNPTMRKTFAKDYPNAPVTFKNDTVILANLDDATTKLLGEIAGKPEYWEIEDQTLYNIMRSPLCAFEDRDFKALEEAEKKKKAKR